MQKTIQMNGVTVGTITWDQATGLFDFTLEGGQDLRSLLTSIKIRGGLSYLVDLADLDGIEVSEQTMLITQSKFLDQLASVIGRLGYDLL
jgi:hypothetical protein